MTDRGQRAMEEDEEQRGREGGNGIAGEEPSCDSAFFSIKSSIDCGLRISKMREAL
jgi:hypothetical protein